MLEALWAAIDGAVVPGAPPKVAASAPASSPKPVESKPSVEPTVVPEPVEAEAKADKGDSKKKRKRDASTIEWLSIVTAILAKVCPSLVSGNLHT